MNKFYYRVEPFKGYIASDKQRVGDEPYESGFWNIIVTKEIEEEYLKEKSENGTKKAFELVKEKINNNILDFLKTRQQDDIKIKPFYLNFNYDGIDCFVHRWNWKS